MSPIQPVVLPRRVPRQRERGLGDVAAGVRPDPTPVLLVVRGRRVWPDEHAVAAALVHRLHDELGDVLEDVRPLQRVGGDVGLHVRQDLVLAEVVLDDGRHVGVDRFVVGHTGADGVREGHPAHAVRGEESGYTEERIAPKGQRIQEVVIDPPVDHIHALAAAGRAHVDGRVVHEQVGALHHLDAHGLGQEGVLEERGVVDARREQDHRRLVGDRLGDGAEDVEEVLRIPLDRPDVVVGEDLRPHPLHHATVLDHIGDTRGRPEVVLENVELAARVAHQVAADHVGVDAAGDLDPAELAAVPTRAEDELRRHEAAAEDLLLVVDVVQEQVERPDPLLEPTLDPPPLLRRDDPRDEIERDDLLEPARILVDGEGDAARLEGQLRRDLAARHVLR